MSTPLELFVWAIAGGVFIVIITACTGYLQNNLPSKKHLSRDFLLGAAFTGFVFPLLPETFDTIGSTALGGAMATGEAMSSALAGAMSSGSVLDPDVKVGPANF